MRVLVACEFSGVVRDAFIARGHDAMSCDILETDRPGPHYQGDVLDILDDGFDLMVAHPPCTYLTNAGVRHLHSVPFLDGTLPRVHGAERWALMEESATFFRLLLNADIPRIAVENPTPHGYATARIGRKYDQAIQPWMFGHGETKRTCLWLESLPPLIPTMVVDGREARIHRMSPGKDRAKLRSITYQGIADAMADQWGSLPVVSGE
jgi:hypothetical protein